MIDQNAQLEELPEYWQERIHRYRAENYSLRMRLNKVEHLELSPRWQKALADLRKENGKYRTERKALQVELDAARAEIEALRNA